MLVWMISRLLLCTALVLCARPVCAQATGAPASEPTGTESSLKIQENVTVEGTMPRDGYRVESATSLGALGTVTLLDTPYAVSILPGELMTNGQVKNFKEASKYLPLVEFQEMQGSEILRPATRGMQGSNMQNARMDGMGIVVTGA